MIKLLEFLWSGCFHNWETIKEQGRVETYNISYPDGGKRSYKEQYTQYTLRCKNCGHIKSVNVGGEDD
jgi:uncharacterized OB-fold protein